MVRALAAGLVIAAAAGVAGPGCDGVFGPDPYDVPSYSLAMTTSYVAADQITDVPADLSGGATLLVEDPAAADGYQHVPAEILADRWYWRSAADDATFMFRTPDADVVRIWHYPARDVVGRTTVLQRPDPSPGNLTDKIAVDATLQSTFTAGSFQVFVIGAWTQHNYGGTDLPGAGSATFQPANVDYGDFVSVPGTTLWEITRNDRVVVLRFGTAGELVGAMLADRLDQTDPTTIHGVIADVPQDREIDIMTDPNVLTRTNAQRPTLGPAQLAWALNASPGADRGFTAGPQLASGVISLASPPQLTATYGNPLPWQALIHVNLTAARATGVTGLPGTAMCYGGAITVAPPEIASIPLATPMPITVSLAGTDLIADNLAVTIDRTRPVDITAAFDVPGTGRFVAQLIELVPDGANAFKRIVRAQADGTAPSWRVPAGVFDAGTPYVIRALLYSEGTGDLASGDETTVTLPLSVGYLDSGIFTVE